MCLLSKKLNEQEKKKDKMDFLAFKGNINCCKLTSCIWLFYQPLIGKNTYVLG